MVLESMQQYDARKRRERLKAQAAKLLASLLVIGFSCAITGVLSYQLGFRKGQEAERNLPRKPVVMLQPANDLIRCDRSGLDEILRHCRAKARMERVKP